LGGVLGCRYGFLLCRTVGDRNVYQTAGMIDWNLDNYIGHSMRVLIASIIGISIAVKVKVS
jgi:hypothetical protein